LQALFPTSFAQTTLDKNGGFDVCRSRNANTYFQRWDEIKHNIILNWVDVRDESTNAGLALFSEHTTAYTHGPDHPLSLVLGWGWEGGFWWGKCPLLGEHRAQYSVMPHRGDWQETKLWQEVAKEAEPLLPMLVDGRSFVGPASRSLVKIGGEGIQISSMSYGQKAFDVRVFNARASTSHCQLTCGFKPIRAHIIDLKGTAQSQLTMQTAPSGEATVSFTIPQFGLRTVRLLMP